MAAKPRRRELVLELEAESLELETWALREEVTCGSKLAIAVGTRWLLMGVVKPGRRAGRAGTEDAKVKAVKACQTVPPFGPIGVRLRCYVDGLAAFRVKA